MTDDLMPPLQERFRAVLLATPRTGWTYEPGQERHDHHQAGEGQPGHSYSIACALCTGDLDALTTALVAALPPQICGAISPPGIGGQPLGPCLRAPHEDVVHQAPDGTKWWWPTNGSPGAQPHVAAALVNTGALIGRAAEHYRALTESATPNTPKDNHP